MGMFDWVRFEIEIPGRDCGYPWQTNTFPAPNLREYEVTAEGELRQRGELVRFTGDLELYDINEDATQMLRVTLAIERGIVRGMRQSSEVIGDSSNDIVIDPRHAAATD